MSAARADVPYVSEPGPGGTRFSEIRHFAEIDSTNRYLVDEARFAPRPGLVALADHQTAGRGRLGRRWEAPARANLLVSTLFQPTVPAEQLHLCSVAVALAAARACHQVAGLEPSLKWPNDLVVDDRKLGGILAESIPVADEVGGSLPAAIRAVVVVGLGLNVGWPPPDAVAPSAPVPDELRGLATSIYRETGATFAPRRLLDPLLVELEHRLVQLDDPVRRIALASEFRERCSTLGRRVRVVLTDDETIGTAVDITTEGHLVVDVGPCFVTISAGDVVHVRPES